MVLQQRSITAFLDWLRNGNSGFEASDQQYLAGQALIETVIGLEIQSLTDALRWKTLLAPVLCSSQAQQTEFYELFSHWFELPKQFITANPAPEANPIAIRKTVRNVWLYSGCASSLLAITLFGTYRLHLKRNTVLPTADVLPGKRVTAAPHSSDTIVVRAEAHSSPVPGAQVDFGGTIASTDANGYLTLLRRPSSDYVLVTAKGYEPYVAPFPQNDGILEMATQEPIRLPNVWYERLETYGLAIKLCALLLPLSLVAAWLIERWKRWLELRRWNSLPQPKMSRLVSRKQADPLFRGSDMRMLTTRLRRRRPEISPELDVPPTIEKTCKEGGFFAPVFARLTSEPEYLFLGERKNMSDQQARYQDELIGRLRDHDISIQRYYFQSDPSFCSDVEGSVVTLNELAVVFPNHELWLALEPKACLDPVTDEPKPWFSTLENWNDRALLAYGNMPSTLGIRAAAPTRRGLEKLSGYSDKPVPEAPLPLLLRDSAERWVQSAEPLEAKTPRLETQLKMYLGLEGFLLLQGCAVYPALAWNITRILAAELVPEEHREDSLARIAALPWFRHGIMPDWMRVRLLMQLGDNEPKVRAALRRYLDQAVIETRGKQDALDVVPGTPPKKARRATLKDNVFLSFVSKKPLDKLSVEAPAVWSRFLRDPLTLRISFAIGAMGVIWLFIGGLISDLKARLASHPGAIVTVQLPGNPYEAGLYTVARSLEVRPDLRAARGEKPDLFLYSSIYSNAVEPASTAPKIPNPNGMSATGAMPGMAVYFAGSYQIIEAVVPGAIKLFQGGWVTIKKVGMIYSIKKTETISARVPRPVPPIEKSRISGGASAKEPSVTNSSSGTSGAQGTDGGVTVVVNAGKTITPVPVVIISARAFQRTQSLLQKGVPGFSFGENWTTLNKKFDPPYSSSTNEETLPVAGEFSPAQVHYVWRRFSELQNDPAFQQYFSLLEPFAECMQGDSQSYVTFLFQNNQLFRISARYFDECSDRQERFEEFLRNLGLSIKASGTFDKWTITLGPTSMTWKPGSQGYLLDIWKTGSPVPVDIFDPLPTSKTSRAASENKPTSYAAPNAIVPSARGGSTNQQQPQKPQR